MRRESAQEQAQVTRWCKHEPESAITTLGLAPPTEMLFQSTAACLMSEGTEGSMNQHQEDIRKMLFPIDRTH